MLIENFVKVINLIFYMITGYYKAMLKTFFMLQQVKNNNTVSNP